MLTHLLLMRHAKSSWADAAQTDHERPLKPRGKRAATAVGQALHARGYAPQMIWSSDATRTRQTAMNLIRAIPGAQAVNYHAEMYHASPSEMLALAERLGEPEGVERLMWLGHNPGWAELHGMFSNQSHRYPTAACTVLGRVGGADWLSPDSWRMVDFILPRELDA